MPCLKAVLWMILLAAFEGLLIGAIVAWVARLDGVPVARCWLAFGVASMIAALQVLATLAVFWIIVSWATQ